MQKRMRLDYVVQTLHLQSGGSRRKKFLSSF